MVRVKPKMKRSDRICPMLDAKILVATDHFCTGKLELYHALAWTRAAKLPVSYRALESRFRNMRLFYGTR